MRARSSILLPLLLGGLLFPLTLPGCSDNDVDPCADGTATSCQPGSGDDAGVDASDDGGSPSADAGHDASSDADAPDGGGEKPGTASATIGAEGGTIEVLGLTLEVPAGALQEDTLVTVTRTGLPAPGSGYTPLYRFDPEGLVFDLPVSASFWLPADFLSKPLTTFWSKLDNPSVYEDIGGEIGAEAVVAKTSHFSTAYVGLSEGEEPGNGCSSSGSFSWAVENPLPTDVTFGSVAATSADDVYAASGEAPDEARHWNGSSFARLNVPARAAYAAGPGNVFLATPTGVARGSGTSFVAEEMGAVFNAVHGSGPDNVWAVGANGNVRRWNGSAWAPIDIGATHNLISVWVGSETSVWIGVTSAKTPYEETDPAAISYDGVSFRTWTKADFGLPAWSNGPRSIWGSGASDVYFCGMGELSATALRRFDGVEIKEVAGIDGCGSVSGRSSSEIYFTKRAVTEGDPTLFRFDGSNTTELAAIENLTAVDASAPGVVAVGGWAGTFGIHDGTTLEMHSSGFQHNVSRVWVSPTGEAYAQGPKGIYVGECGTWRAIDGMTGSHGGIDGLSANEVWIGAIGGVRRVNGTKFDVGPVEPYGIGDPDDTTRAVYVEAADSVFASGWADGAKTWVRHWNGSAWTDITPTSFDYPGYDRFVSVQPGEIFMTGGNGVLRWKDGSWTTEATGGTGGISDLVSLGNGEILALNGTKTEDSRIRGADGTWRSAGFPAGAPVFRSAWARAADDVYAACYFNCGGRDYLWHWDGSTWSQPAKAGYLDYVHGNAAGDVIAVGNQGRIWRRARR